MVDNLEKGKNSTWGMLLLTILGEKIKEEKRRKLKMCLVAHKSWI